MRRKQCENTDPEHISQVLTSCRVGRLATIGNDGYPYITPVNYVWFREAIFFHTALAGEKLENISRNPKVCFEVDVPLSYLDLASNPKADPCRLHQLYHCVIIRGRAELVEIPAQKAEALNALVQAHEPGGAFSPVTAQTPALAACGVIRIQPESISAKSDLLQGKEERVVDDISDYLLQRDKEMDAQTVKAIKEIRVGKRLVNRDTP